MKKVKILVLLTIIIILGFGTTVAADNSVPGDLLFPLDRAIENLRISLASADSKVDLRIEFAEERVQEFGEIVEEEVDESEEEPVSDEDSVRLDHGLQIAIETIENILSELLPENEIAIAALEEVLNRLNGNLVNLPDKITLRIEERSGDDSKDRLRIEVEDDEVEIKSRRGGQRIEIKMKDGELEIKIKDDDDDDDEDDDDDDDDDEDDDDDDDDDDEDDGDDDDNGDEN